MVRAANPLQQSRGALGRAHLHNAINIAPIDTQIERACADESAQFSPRHCALDLAPRFFRQTAVMNPDGQIVLIHIPQKLEQKLGQKTRIGEDERGVVRLDLFIQLRDCPAPCMTAPRDAAFLWQQDIELGVCAILAFHQRNCVHITPRGEPCSKRFGLRDCGRQSRALHIGRNRLQARQG